MKRLSILFCLLFVLTVGFLNAQSASVWSTTPGIGINSTTIMLNWELYGANAIDFIVYPSTGSTWVTGSNGATSARDVGYNVTLPNAYYTLYYRLYANNSWTGYYWGNPVTAYSKPNPPVLSTPNNGASGQSNSLYLYWSAGTGGAYSYDVYVGTSYPGTYVGNTSNTYWYASSLAFSTNYYWKVVARNSVNYTSWDSSIYSFSTAAAPIPAAPSIGSSYSYTTSSFTASWSASSYATNYYLDVSLNSSFTAPVLSNQSVGNVTSYNITGLSVNTAYYYRVRAYNSSGYSGYSSYNGGGTIPYNANLSTPSSGQTGISVNPTLYWTAPSGGASAYKYYVGTTNPPTNVYNGTATGSTSASVALAYNTLYYWRVVAYNGYGDASSSSTWTFTTQAPPVPAAPTALNATSMTTSGFTASWTAATYATNYYLDVSTNSGFSTYVSGYQNLSLGNVTTKQVTGLSSSTQYYFRLRANNSSGTSASTAYYAVVTLCGAPTLAAPANGVSGVTAPTVSLSWTAPSGLACNYKYYVGTDNPPTNIANASTTGEASATISVDYSTLYYWRVVGYNASGDGTSSPTWSFTTAGLPVPGEVTSPSPAFEAVNQSITTGLSWAAPITGGAMSGAYLYLWSFDTGLNISHLDTGMDMSYNPGTLGYNSTYYWQVIPYNATGTSSNAAVWSFTTTDQYVETLPEVTPPTGGTVVPQIVIPSLSGTFVSPTITTDWNPAGSGVPNAGLYISLTGTNMSGRRIVINPSLGYTPMQLAYRVAPALNWFYVNVVTSGDAWTPSYVYFNVPALKADGDVEVIFPASEGDTLPVELSSFSAIASSLEYVTLQWTTQSETGMSGYYVFRNTENNLATAFNLGRFVTSTNSSSGYNYTFSDTELDGTGIYFYWLEAVELDGNHAFYGSVKVTVTDGGTDTTPTIPNETKLVGISPNPFNPSTKVSYTLREAGNVTLEIYNQKGQKIHQHTITNNAPGTYSYVWNATGMASGIYFVRMTSGTYYNTKKMILSK